MIGFFIFLCVAAAVFILLAYRWGHDVGMQLYDQWCQEDLAELEERNYEKWSWLRGANARRKNMERALKAQQRKNADLRKKLFKVGWELGSTLIRSSKLVEENASLEKRNRALAAELTSDLLSAQDREGVIKGLTRKL